MSWTIKGESGATLNATERTLETLRIEAATLQFQSLASDTLSWSAKATDATGAGTIIPDAGQVVTLWKNGVRKFTGHATLPTVGVSSIRVSVEGPWWWMDRIPISSKRAGVTDKTGTSTATSERPTFVFPTQNLRLSLQKLINSAVLAGVPMESIPDGSLADRIDAIYTVPKITLSEMSYGAALAELLRWVPDAVAWFDYSGTLPALHITRRGAMPATTLAIGTNVTMGELRPRLDLEVSRTELHYVTRQTTTGRPQWARQAYGTAAPGKKQMITISGPEIASILPKDDFQSARLRTAPIYLSLAYALEFDTVIKDAVRQYGNLPGSVSNFASYKNTWRVVDGATKDFMVKDLGLKTWNQRVCGWLYFFTPYFNYSVLSHLISMGRVIVTNRIDLPDYYSLWVDFTLPAVNLNYPKLTTVYKKWDYDFLNPPADLAANLLNAQNWVPWEGQVTTVADEVTGNPGLDRKYHVTGTATVCTTMAALAKSVTHDITSGRTTTTLGAPPRTDFGTLVGRIRREPADNIVYL